jgi:DhnA family fructose-bisphosphate aldolase class Ia
MKPRLAEKLAALRADLSAPHFILADAKDADLAWGAASAGMRSENSGLLPSAGRVREGGCVGDDSATSKVAPSSSYRSINDYRDQIREVVRQGAIDILLASASTLSILAHGERLFDDSDVTPAVRANDTTDIWLPRGGRYHEEPSRPFTTGYIEEAQYGSAISARLVDSHPVVNLGLYSVTFNNRVDDDHATLEAFRAFRAEAERCTFRYFLEVFPPNIPGAVADEHAPGFVNDSICRMLAGVPVNSRPEFLKMPYFGPAALEELVAYDPSMIVGILGGASGTTYDAFKLLAEAKQHGARAALFGRKIKEAEHPVTMITLLREVADGETTPEEAVRAYHAELAKLMIKSRRALAEDAQLTAPELQYLVT